MFYKIFIRYFLCLAVFSLLISCDLSTKNLYSHPSEKLTFTSLDNQSVNFKEFKGKYLIINYWASWCSPCVKEIPELVSFTSKYQDKAYVIGVNLEDISDVELNNFISKFNINYPNFKQDIMKILFNIEVVGFPTTYIIDKDGNLLKTIQGQVSMDDLEHLVS